MKKLWLIVSLVSFLIASMMGLLLIEAFILEMGWMDFTNILNGHAHVALGSIYLYLIVFCTAILWFKYLSVKENICNPFQKAAVSFLVLGLLLTELIMVLQVFIYWQELGKLPYFYAGSFYASCILPIATAILLTTFQKKEYQLKTKQVAIKNLYFI